MIKSYFLLCFSLFLSGTLLAQEPDLLSMLGEDETIDYATASFKTNRIINGHSLESTSEGVLDFKISHRFTQLREGVYDIFGLDGASIRFGFDYGITNRFTVGVGRNSKDKVYDGYLKYKLLRQCKGKRNIPVTVAYVADIQINTTTFSEKDRENYGSSRLSFSHQLLVGRKLSDRVTFQLSPTLVHRNLVKTKADKNDVLALGIGGRIKLTKRTAFNAEYYYVLPNQIDQELYYNSLSLGFDIETGGHVFQLHFTNSNDMTYKGFITETTEGWFYKNAAGKMLSGVRFGFNVSRVFTVKKPRNID